MKGRAGHAQSGCVGTDPADLDSLVTHSLSRKPHSFLNNKKVVPVPRQPARLGGLMGHLDLGGLGLGHWGGVSTISYSTELEFGINFGDSRERATHKKITIVGRGVRRT